MTDWIISFRQSILRPYLRAAIPPVVGILGLLATIWLTAEVYKADRERLQLRFQREAQERAEMIIRPFEERLKTFAVLQRVLQTVGDVDEKTFRGILEPMSRSPGSRAFGWAQRVEGQDRARFERFGKKRWGEEFSIKEMGDGEGMVPSRDRDFYFPMIYQVPDDDQFRLIRGLDLYAHADRGTLIERAIDEGVPVASRMGASIVDYSRSNKIVVFMAPVYRGGEVPMLWEDRRGSIGWVMVAALDMAELFDAANSVAQNGLHASMYDHADPEMAVRRWSPGQDGADRRSRDDPPSFTRNFWLAGQEWMLRIDADKDWLKNNAAGRENFIAIAGIVLTLLLIFLLRRLLGLNELVESRANKLAMVVAQNPSSILITDLRGRIEYVNEAFLEASGRSREEVLGSQAGALAFGEIGKETAREIQAAMSSGTKWQGDLPDRRPDGTPCWERVWVSPIKDRQGAVENCVVIKENITELREVMNRLRESEGRFRGAMAVMAEGLAILSSDGRIIFANRAAEEILGGDETALQNLEPENLPFRLVREDGIRIRSPLGNPQTMRELCESREVRNFVVGLRSTDGAVRWLEINTSPLHLGKAEERGVVMTFSDITERRHAEEQSKLAFEAIRHSGEGILVTDTDHRIISANPAFVSVTGYSEEEVAGYTPAIFSSEQEDASFFGDMREILERTGHWQGEVWNRRKNGEVYPEWLGISTVREADGRPKYYVYIFSDMTERKAAQERIEFLAHHDPLTELPNRLLLRDRMEQAMTYASRMKMRVAMMFLDLDRFKKINDSLGHPVGDALLKAVVDRLRGCVRESDTISRQGGDEFIILLHDVRDSDAVSRVAEKILQRMNEPFAIGEYSLISSFSIGVAMYPDDGEDFDSLLQKADTAMYYAKESGRNSLRFFTEQMNLQVVENMTMETRLRYALENGQFVLHYQPQLDLQEGTIVGIEALIRWNSPEDGLVPPAKFIPVAEDSGLIVQIGAWVLIEACRQARAWQEAGLPPCVMAVNLSAIQFKRLDLVGSVINALVLSDLDSQWLELELTESILIQDAETTLDTVRRLKSLGIKLSVDDFGTGYSSLAYLKRFAVDKLKIDQSFVRDLVTDPDDSAIVRAIIQMAHSLKLRTIAEGVESQELCDMLRLFHCDEVQGYWLARPMPADEMEEFLRKRLENVNTPAPD